jgi:hypothetical protein
MCFVVNMKTTKFQVPQSKVQEQHIPPTHSTGLIETGGSPTGQFLERIEVNCGVPRTEFHSNRPLFQRDTSVRHALTGRSPTKKLSTGFIPVGSTTGKLQKTAKSKSPPTVESFLYTYDHANSADALLTSVLLRRHVNGGTWQNVHFQAQITGTVSALTVRVQAS